MRQIVVIKGYAQMTAAIKTGADVSPEDEGAVARFRAFHPVAEIHASRMTDPLAIDAALEVVDDLRNLLQKKRQV